MNHTIRLPQVSVFLAFAQWAALLTARLRQSLALLGVFVAVFCGSSAAFAQAPNTEPSTQDIINQLNKPKTRSLSRNLVVEPGAPVPPKPSVSLLVQFDFDSANVRPESQQVLQNLAEALRSNALRDAKFAVEGHTDAKGAVDYNRKLSQARAEAVAKFLAAREVDSARLVASGKGSSELANPASPFAAENRRVRIVNLD